MKVSDFNYNLPKELIAQVPIKDRDQSRLMVLDRKNKTIEHKIFKDIIDYLEPDDCLVRNNTESYSCSFIWSKRRKLVQMLNFYY